MRSTRLDSQTSSADFETTVLSKFDGIDKDGSGELNKAEFEDGLQQMRQDTIDMFGAMEAKMQEIKETMDTVESSALKAMEKLAKGKLNKD